MKFCIGKHYIMEKRLIGCLSLGPTRCPSGCKTACPWAGETVPLEWCSAKPSTHLFLKAVHAWRSVPGGLAMLSSSESTRKGSLSRSIRKRCWDWSRFGLPKQHFPLALPMPMAMVSRHTAYSCPCFNGRAELLQGPHGMQSWHIYSLALYRRRPFGLKVWEGLHAML